MNFVTLLQQHPLLCADLQGLGLSRNNMQEAAAEITTQLGGCREFNMCYVIAALNSREFIRRIDTAAIARRLQISPSLAQAVVLMFAPWVNQFQLQAT